MDGNGAGKKVEPVPIESDGASKHGDRVVMKAECNNFHDHSFVGKIKDVNECHLRVSPTC